MFFALAMLLPACAGAATLGVTADQGSAVLGQSFEAHVTLDTNGEAMNAVQGDITFPAALFSFAGINDGDSPVTFWVEAPHEIVSGTVAFSGIVPGGFNGVTQSLVGVMLTPLARGAGVVAIADVQLLRNDGQGSAIAVATSSLTMTVAAAAPGSYSGPSEPSVRFTTPENFIPAVAQDPTVYGGKYFVAFSATDKGSGINHYEVLEVPAGSGIGQAPAWRTATSPYLLTDQMLSSDIYVRAVNNAGNATTVKVAAKFSASNHGLGVSSAVVLILVFLFAVSVAVLAVAKRRRRAKSNNV